MLHKTTNRGMRPSIHRKQRQSKQVDHEPHLLCVDDDSDLTRIIKTRLQQQKIDVTRATSGREGIKLVRSHRPDVIVTDLGMPGGNGEYLLRRLGSRQRMAQIPIIVLSGIADQERIVSAYRLGAVAVLRKPCNFNQLIEEIASYLMPDTREVNEVSEKAQSLVRFESASGNSCYAESGHSVLRPKMFAKRQNLS